MQLTQHVDLTAAAADTIAQRPMGYSVLTLLNALYGELSPTQRRRFMGIAMPSVESENLGANRWVNTKLLEATGKDHFVIVAENAQRKDIIVTYWNDHRTRNLSESTTYSFMDFKLVVDEVSYFLRHGTKRRDEGGSANNVLLFRRQS